jgi:hypothetical protein
MEIGHFEDTDADWRIILKMDLQNVGLGWGYGLD